MKLALPGPVQAALEAANANDMEAFLDCFSDDAVIGDRGWEFQGRDEIRAWSDREFIGRKVSPASSSRSKATRSHG